MSIVQAFLSLRVQSRCNEGLKPHDGWGVRLRIGCGNGRSKRRGFRLLGPYKIHLSENPSNPGVMSRATGVRSASAKNGLPGDRYPKHALETSSGP
jgi:hypothetical protein